MTAPSNVTSIGLPQMKCPNMLAVASGKGGVGKTWFAATLSQAVAQGNRTALLFDGDLGLANVDIQLGLTPAVDLGQVIAGKASLRQARTPTTIKGFDVVAGRSGSGSLGTLPLNRVTHLLTDLVGLSADYDQIILDIGAGIDRSVRLLAGYAQTVLVVTTPEPTALTDSYAFIKVMLQQDRSADLRIVVNMAANEREGQQTYDKLSKVCENFLKVKPPLAGIIRRDAKVADAIRHQEPIFNRHPDCNAAKDVLALLDRLKKA